MLRFHTPGIPLKAKIGNTLNSLIFLKEEGLDGIEIQFTHGVNISSDLAAKIASEAKKLDLSLTIHGPYWINLNAKLRPKFHASISYIFQTMKIADILGAKSITFHPAYIHDNSPEEVFGQVTEGFNLLLEKCGKAEISTKSVHISPELTGKPSQFGDLDELIKLSSFFKEKIRFCIDFSHFYARTGGKENGKKSFQNSLDKIKSALGKEFLKDMHMHMGGMVYGPKGERHHRPLAEETEFKWKELLEVLKLNDVGGWITIETPDVETSTKLARDYYYSL